MLQNQSNILYVFCFFNFHYQNRSSELNYYIKLFSNANLLNKNIKCKLYVYNIDISKSFASIFV